MRGKRTARPTPCETVKGSGHHMDLLYDYALLDGTAN